MRHAVRHARRLRRDALALGLVPPDERAVSDALVDIGRAAFGEGAGIVRLALRPGPGGDRRARLAAQTRAIGAEARAWRAITWPEAHPGAADAAGAKREGVAFYGRARDGAQRAGVDDALLASAEGLLVEGARTSVFVAVRGALLTPPVARGAVAGIAREIVLETVREAREEDVPMVALAGPSEVVLVNAVRGAVRLAWLDGRPLAAGSEPSWTTRLDDLLRSDPPAPAAPTR
ncbi:MAG: aminotransferase class IV [Deltaproteobacteria bacterium]|nr:aminotransferase class IV [Deltaproteobacteria bacterium]